MSETTDKVDLDVFGDTQKVLLSIVITPSGSADADSVSRRGSTFVPTTAVDPWYFVP